MPYTPVRRLRLTDGLPSRLARLHPPLSVRAFAARADLAYSTLRAAIDPTQQPQRNPQGGVYETTARKIARAYAEAAGIGEDAAYTLLIVETQGDGTSKSAR